MAESTKGKKKKKLDALADDIDEMLKTQDTSTAEQVGIIDDDDAIDRLLIGDNFMDASQESDSDEFADFEGLIDDDFAPNLKIADGIDILDEFAEEVVGAKIDSGQLSDQIVDNVEELDEPDNENSFVESIEDQVDIPELNELERVLDIDEFADHDHAAPISMVSEIPIKDSDSMVEIEEFTNSLPPEIADRTNFLMADFDISSDDSIVETISTSQMPDEIDQETDLHPFIPSFDRVNFDDPAPAGVEPQSESQHDLAQAFELTETESVSIPVNVNKTVPPPVDHSAELADLAKQIANLKRQQQAFKLEMTEKALKNELHACLEGIDSLQTEQKKTKRSVDAFANTKPIAAYVANGLAGASLLFAAVLAFQIFIAKTQIDEIVQLFSKLQQQVGAAPAADAADREMLRKEMNELAVADSVAANQIAEINKVLQGGAASGKTGGDVGKQIAELNTQNMQIGASIESLQNKVSALEKMRTAAALPAAKTEKKKPVTPEENWAVNLIAYKQDWYAKRKAEEYAAKGIPAKVSKSESKGENWYRLSVDGFRSQYEAAGYAAKVKKTLNLDSVWVTRNKE